jgi:hypothetical protein
MARINVYRYPEDEPPFVDGWFNIDKATAVKELTRWDGNDMISVHAPQFEHEMLYRTAGGRWVRHAWSQWQGTNPTYEYITPAAAKAWLVRNESDDLIAEHFGELEDERGPGRPAIGDVIGVRFPDALLAAVDAYADGKPRAEAIRELVTAALNLVSAQ